MLDNLTLFIKIVDHGNFIKASRVLNIYPSKINRRMGELEQALGVQLFKKHVLEMELTESGQLLYTTFQTSIYNLNAKIDEFKYNTTHKIEGNLNIYLPPLFASLFINQHLVKFITKYPQITLNLNYLVLNTHELNSFPFDIAVSRIPSSRPFYSQQVIFKTKLILAASKEYLDLHDTPSSIEELDKHPIIRLATDIWSNQFTAVHEVSQEKQEIKKQFNIIHNSSLASIDFLSTNAGIIFILENAFNQLVTTHNIKRVLPDYHFGEVKFFLIHPNFEITKKSELFKDFILDCVSLSTKAANS